MKGTWGWAGPSTLEPMRETMRRALLAALPTPTTTLAAMRSSRSCDRFSLIGGYACGKLRMSVTIPSTFVWVNHNHGL